MNGAGPAATVVKKNDSCAGENITGADGTSVIVADRFAKPGALAVYVEFPVLPSAWM